MVDIQVLDGGSENQKGVDIAFEKHQTLLIHCPPHLLHLTWGDFTKPKKDRTFLQQLNFVGNWVRHNFHILRKYLPLSGRQKMKENAEKLSKPEHLPQGIETRWNSYLEEILVLLDYIKDLQNGIFRNWAKELCSRNKNNKTVQIVYAILKDEDFNETCRILAVIGTKVFKPLLGFFESKGLFVCLFVFLTESKVVFTLEICATNLLKWRRNLIQCLKILRKNLL